MGNVSDRLESPITEKESEEGQANNLCYGVSSMQGWRASMEDQHNIIGSLKDVPNISFFGVYDGHGGKFTSDYISKYLPKVFENRKEFRDYKNLSQSDRDDVKGIKLLKNACIATFLEMDAALLRIKKYARSKSPSSLTSFNESVEYRRHLGNMPKVERSGSTCVVVIVTPSHIICANAGDSRACFKRDCKALPLSFDHKPMNTAEHSRIKNAGGTVTAKRIDGDLAVSRGLGDFQFKQRDDLPPEKQKVSCIPDVTVYPRNHDKDEFIVIACDGIWDVVSNEECVELVQQIFNEGETQLSKVSEEMLDICLRKGSRDNMSLAVVTLPAVKIGKGGGVDARRERRFNLIETTCSHSSESLTPIMVES